MMSEDVAVSVLNELASLDARASMVAEKGARPGLRIAHQENSPLVRAEDEIVELERRLMLSLEAGQIGTFQIDLEKEEIILDPQQGRLLNLAPSIRQLSLCELDSMLSKRAQKSLKERIIDAGVRYSDELQLLTPDACERWLSFSTAPIGGANSNSRYYFGVCLDITARKLVERRRLLSREGEHRAKNLLTVVLAIARLTAREHGSPAFVEKLTQSIEGLAASFLLLVENEWQVASIFELIKAQIASFGGLFGNQITFEGRELTIRPRAAQALGMAFHELITNSIKYGALSERAGRISIRWSIQDPGNQFCMTWSERGGPEPKAPARNGFGYTVIVTAVEGATGGNVRLQYPVSGLVWEVTAPLDQII